MAATRKLTVEILGDAKGALGAFGSVNKGLGGLGQDFVNFGKKVALGFAAFTAGAVVLGRDFVNAASDLNESISKTEVVFGDAAKAVIDFSKTTASAMGQSQRSSLAAASNFGIFGKSAGLAGEDLSNFTIDLVTLASDLASFNNTTPEEAIEALGAALRGEAEPMRKYGVLLDDASLRQKALEMGIYDGNGALTSQQKILAANALIFEKTSDAQGDFARTSDGVANSSRTLSARFDDLKTKIGTFLLPIALKIVEAFGWLAEKVEDLANKYLPKLRDIFDDVREKIEPVVEALRDELQPIFEKIVNWMRENTGTVKVFLGVITGAAVIAGILALAAAVTALFSPIILIIGAIALIAAAFYYAYTEIEGFREVVDGIIAFFRDEVAPKIAEAYDKIKEKIQEFSDWFDENSQTFSTIWNNIKIAFETGAAVVSAIWDRFGGTITSSLQSTVGTIFSIVQNLFGVLSGIFQTISGVLSGNWGMMWDGIKQTTSSAISIVGNLISLGFMPIRLAFEGINSTLSNLCFPALSTFL